MGRLRLLSAAAMLCAAMPARADPVARWEPYMREASARFGIPIAWIERVISAESGGRTHIVGRRTVSRAGAMGLMQVMPNTWVAMRRAYGLGNDPHRPRDNILAGTAYLRAMYDRFGYPGLFAAYNAGPARYAEHLARGTALPVETRAYLAAVAGHGAFPAKAAAREDPVGLFAIRRDLAQVARPRPATAAASALFFSLDQR